MSNRVNSGAAADAADRARAAAEQQRRADAERARREASRAAAQHEHAAAAQAGAFRGGFSFQNPFGRSGASGARAAGSNTALRNHVQTLGTGGSCQPRAANADGFNVSMSVEQAPRKKEHHGFLHNAVSTVGHVVAKTPVDDVAKFGIDTAGKVGHLASAPAGFVLDRTRDFIDVAKDVAHVSPADVGKALQTAAQTGLKLGGFLQNEARKIMRHAMDKGLQIGKQVDKLGVGDSYKLGGDFSLGIGVGGGASGGIEIERTAKGFTVSGEMKADVGLGLSFDASAGVGGRAEFKFKTAKEAKQAALILAGTAAAVAGPPPLRPALMPSGKEIDFLKSHLSAVELSASASAKVDAKLGAGPAELGGAAGAAVTGHYRVEFEGGKPAALVYKGELSGSAKADVALKLVKKFGGDVGGQLTAKIKDGVELSQSVTFEARVALGPSGLSDLGAVAARLGRAEFSLTASVTADGGDKGVQVQAGVSGLSLSEVRHAATALAHGRVGEAIAGVDVEASGTYSDFVDHGFDDLGFDLKLGKVGVEASVYAERRDVRHQFGIGTD